MPQFDYSWGPTRLTKPVKKALPRVPVERDMVLEDPLSGFVGAVVRIEKSGGAILIELEDRHGAIRAFPLGPGLLLDGQAIDLTPPAPTAPKGPQRTASGSVKVAGQRARTARASRIWVEGKHDAELIEKVWGDDLRVEGIVVEPLHGVDDLGAAIADFAPSPTRRLGILVDHLVDGTKESRIRDAAMRTPGARGNVLIVGHPYVDVWQTVKPGVLGLAAWPTVPRGQDWKTGILRGLGWPHASQADVANGWRRILGAVTTYADLEPSLLGRVEEVIDFVTVPPGAGPA
ncbi:DUF3097 domain-containing protein [Falsarthrobacter nasiphocae]|uniref:DUF3097 domain-containing protein n=1 Tax=Falsarthrobacter nasiphocae TaxID=189863 RepID=A0AAE4C630_9MICC|nr:DUF3097 domain-containing protein [Falsarthrobacter nasiphocae]MDR6891069.1 hypothetical protein [Falsarthrobacter nasiphocae]